LTSRRIARYQYDARAHGRQPLRGDLANARRGTGDDNDFAFHMHPQS
jgi:hypothetical protein